MQNYFNLTYLKDLKELLSEYDELVKIDELVKLNELVKLDELVKENYSLKNFMKEKKRILIIDIALAYLFYLKWCKSQHIELQHVELQHVELHQAVTIISNIVEGIYKQKFFLTFMAFLENKKPFVTGSGATLETRERIKIYQQVTGIEPKKMKKISSKYSDLKKPKKITKKDTKIDKKKPKKVKKKDTKIDIFNIMLERVRKSEDYSFIQLCKTIYFDHNLTFNGW